MIRRFCDACGAEVEKNYVMDRLIATKTFRQEAKQVEVKVECIVTIDGTTNKGEMCRDCVIDTVDMADTRPRQG